MAVGALWAVEGDIGHADGSTERGRRTIQQNRTEQFMRKEYRGSRPILSFGSVRCLSESVAVVDSKWELRGVLDATGNLQPNADGLSTLVVQRWPLADRGVSLQRETGVRRAAQTSFEARISGQTVNVFLRDTR